MRFQLTTIYKTWPGWVISYCQKFWGMELFLCMCAILMIFLKIQTCFPLENVSSSFMEADDGRWRLRPWAIGTWFECNQDSSAIRFSQRQRMNVKIGPLSYHDLQTNRTNLHMKHQTNPLSSDSANQLSFPHTFSQTFLFRTEFGCKTIKAVLFGQLSSIFALASQNK